MTPTPFALEPIVTDPQPPSTLDENNVLVLTAGSDLRPSTPVRRSIARPWWWRAPGVVVTPKEKTP